MKTLSDYITSVCKDRDMKIEDLQKKLGCSRTTLYRYMKGINRITPDLAKAFIEALNMDMQETLAFSKLASLSAYDQSLVESRYAIDDFLFGKQQKSDAIVDVDMVFYDNDRYLRTLKEVLDYIHSFSEKEDLVGSIKIVNCLNDNIFMQIVGFLENVFIKAGDVHAEHFLGLSETDYLQNAYSFINIFPLMINEKYRLYFREKEMEDILTNDSMLISLEYKENGKHVNRYFSISFYEDGMSECIAFSDKLMYSYLSKGYENLKRSLSSVIQKYDNMDFTDDIISEMCRRESIYIIKPNPCFDKVPYEAYLSMTGRMSSEEKTVFLSGAHGKPIDPKTMPSAFETAFQYIQKRLEYAQNAKQIDVYSKGGLLEFSRTGRLSDHMEHLPAFNHDEINMIVSHIRSRRDNPDDDYKLYITGCDLLRNELVIYASKGYGILISYVYPERTDGLWRVLLVQSKRLASIFCDYIENHIPITHAMGENEAAGFLDSLI